MKRWFENNNRGCIEVATGGGKTTFAIAAYAELLKKKPDLKIVVVVPTTALADQWFVNFEEDLGINETEIKNLTTTFLGKFFIFSCLAFPTSFFQLLSLI